MNISIEQVTDYCYCPLLYKFKHIDGVKMPLRLTEKYEADMHTIAYCFFHQILDGGKIPSIRYLRERWNAIWDQRNSKEEILHTTTLLSSNTIEVDARRRYIRGFRLIKNFYDYYVEKPGSPILVAKQYSIEFGKHLLSGTLELVRECDGIIEVVDFKVDARDIHVATDINLTAASYAFRKLFAVKENRLVYHGLRSGIAIPTTRSKDDYTILAKIINGVERGITQKIFYPVFNNRCGTCTYIDHCRRKEWL